MKLDTASAGHRDQPIANNHMERHMSDRRKMGRRGHRRGLESAAQRGTGALAVAAGLLSLLGPTDSFISAPLPSSRAPGLGYSETRAVSRVAAGPAGPVKGESCRNGRRSVHCNRAMRLSAVAEERTVAESSTQKDGKQEVSNNNMKPFVVVPRRDPREWFDSIKAGAAPRPESLVDLSK